MRLCGGNKMKEMICIACPMGCRLTAEEYSSGTVHVSGNTCKRGEAYGIQEYRCPMRTVTTSVRALNGMRPLCAVKTAAPIPRDRIPEALKQIRSLSIQAPVCIGDLICEDLAGTGVALVATATRPRR